MATSSGWKTPVGMPISVSVLWGTRRWGKRVKIRKQLNWWVVGPRTRLGGVGEEPSWTPCAQHRS